MKNKKDFAIDYLENLNDDKKLDIYNEYCEWNNDDIGTIYHNDAEFLDMAFGDNKEKLVNAIEFGDYSKNDEYVKFDGYGNLKSYCDIKEAIRENFYADEIAECINKLSISKDLEEKYKEENQKDDNEKAVDLENIENKKVKTKTKCKQKGMER